LNADILAGNAARL